MRRTAMVDRRPVHLPQWEEDYSFLPSGSYFSEEVSRDQQFRQTLMNEIYKPDFGEYKFSSTALLHRQAAPEDLGGVTSCKFSSDGKSLLLGFRNGTIQIFCTTAKSIDYSISTGYKGKITGIKLSSTAADTFFASSLAGRVFLVERSAYDYWDCCTLFAENENEIHAMDCGGEDSLTTAGKDSIIRLYDVPSEKLVRSFSKADLSTSCYGGTTKNQGHSKRICCLQYGNTNKNIFISGGWDNYIKVWDVRCADHPVKSIYGFHVTGDSLDILDETILCGQWTSKESLSLIDMGSSKVVKAIDPLNRPILYTGEFMNSAKFFCGGTSADSCSKGDLMLAAGSGTCALEIISIKENVVLHSKVEEYPVLSLDSRENAIAYGGVNAFSVLQFMPRTSKNSIMTKLSSVMMSASSSRNGSQPRRSDTTAREPSPSAPRSPPRWRTPGPRQELGCPSESLLGEKLTRYLGRLEVRPPLGWPCPESESNVPTYNIVMDE